jgi:arsenate reductase-like glutaredoxin family protein
MMDEYTCPIHKEDGNCTWKLIMDTKDIKEWLRNESIRYHFLEYHREDMLFYFVNIMHNQTKEKDDVHNEMFICPECGMWRNKRLEEKGVTAHVHNTIKFKKTSDKINV